MRLILGRPPLDGVFSDGGKANRLLLFSFWSAVAKPKTCVQICACFSSACGKLVVRRNFSYLDCATGRWKFFDVPKPFLPSFAELGDLVCYLLLKNSGQCSLEEGECQKGMTYASFFLMTRCWLGNRERKITASLN